MTSVRILAAWTDRPLDIGSAEVTTVRTGRRLFDWRTSRNALRRVLTLLGEDPDVAGHTFPNRRLSLTHSGGGAVAAGIGGLLPAAVTGLGVDLEQDQALNPRAARFYCSPGELAWLGELPPHARRVEQLRLWTVKEALFKSDPGNRDAPLRRYVTVRPSARTGRAFRASPRHGLAFVYATRTLRDAHLCIAVSADTRRREVLTPAGVPLTFVDVTRRVSALLSVPAGRLSPDTALHDFTGMIVDLRPGPDLTFIRPQLRSISTLGELAEFLGARVRPASP